MRKSGRQPNNGAMRNLIISATSIALVAILANSWGCAKSPESTTYSIAVLPIENVSGDPDQDYLADGMHEALISELAKIPSLRVVGRTSTLRYKDTTMPLSEIAAELGVDLVMEGSLSLSGEQVSITLLLTNTIHDQELWAGGYTRETNILDLQREIASDAADHISELLTPEE